MKEKTAKKHVVENLDIPELKKMIGSEIIDLNNRIRSGRIRKVENENIRIQNLRILCSLSKLFKELIESEEIEMVKDEVEELREIINELED
ncbi:MAG: hypothetical protein ACXVZU_01910, partial [Methanobacteriaceae archaeon]